MTLNPPHSEFLGRAPKARRSSALSLLLTAGLAVAACTKDAPPPAEPAAAVSSGVVTELKGELWQAGKKLAVGDKVTLDVAAPLECKSGRAVVRIDGVGEVRVFPKTSLSFISAHRARLLLGKIWSHVQSTEFVVETATAVAGVRGTDFVVEHSGERTAVLVREGKVAVANRKQPAQEVLVAAGQQSVVTADAPPEPPKPFVPKETEEAWEKETATANDAPGAAPEDTTAPAEAPVNPATPKVVVDRAATEKMEREGKKTKEALEREAEGQRQELKQDEKKQREAFEKDPKAVEKDLEDDMGKRGTLKQEKSKPVEKKKSADMDDFLK